MALRCQSEVNFYGYLIRAQVLSLDGRAARALYVTFRRWQQLRMD